ncbi:MAG: type II secretion system GspH family protein [Candidatus Niameybacter stercoravium]|nr:type II secretion system GspH family protein [Candidatus Niameybacter stercoravium]
MKVRHKREQKAHKLKRRHLLTRKEGVTLIEIIISLAIFGILMVLFTTLMGVATQMRKNVFEQNRSSMKLVKELAEEDSLAGDNKTMTFEFEKEGTKEKWILEIEGQLRSKEEKDVKYYLFVPKK